MSVFQQQVRKCSRQLLRKIVKFIPCCILAQNVAGSNIQALFLLLF